MGSVKGSPASGPGRRNPVSYTHLDVYKRQVFAINPKQLAHFRDRYTSAGAKDDDSGAERFGPREFKS